MHNVLTYNKIWKQRLVNVGTYSYKTCLDYGLTGVMARCTGIKRDIRLDEMETYANYYYLNFRSYIGQHGDSYDRFFNSHEWDDWKFKYYKPNNKQTQQKEKKNSK